LGIIDADLYVPGLNFVFGEADLMGCCALISLTRLRQEFYSLPADSGLFFQRVAKEAVHEIGHTLGLNHCPDVRCVMHFSNSLEDTDIKSSYLCANCARILARKER
jgi:archaemetzincin